MDIPRQSPEIEKRSTRLRELYEALKKGEKVGIDPETVKELDIPETEGQSILEYLKKYFQIN